MIHFFVSNESKLVFLRPLCLELSSKHPRSCYSNESGIHAAYPCGFWPSRHTFADIGLKFSKLLATSIKAKITKFQNCGLKDEKFLYLAFLQNSWIWVLFVMFNKAMNFIRRLNRETFSN